MRLLVVGGIRKQRYVCCHCTGYADGARQPVLPLPLVYVSTYPLDFAGRRSDVMRVFLTL